MILIKSKKIFGPLILISAAMIWGLSFVFQKQGTDLIEMFTFNASRSLVGAVALIPVLLFTNKKKNNTENSSEKSKKFLTKKDLLGIAVVGTCLCIAINFQQQAFYYIETGKIGFITALYMIFVPIFGLFLKKKPSMIIWISVILGLCGMYLLTVGGKADFHFGKGELYSLIGAIFFAIHIIAIDTLGAEIDSVKLSCGQFFVAGILSTIGMFIFEEPDIHAILNAAVPILYAGIMSSSVAFTFQIIGQKYTDPTLASMFLCLESVFSALFAYFLIPEQNLVPTEYIGCAIMFVAILLAQIPPKKKRIE